MSLSRVILQKTLGQAFHVIQFMEMLKDRHFLYYENGRYRFDLDRVQEETNVSENVASLVSERIQKLPSTTRNLLALAACLGFCFATEHFVGLALCERHRAKLLVTADVDIVDDDSEDGDIDIEGIELALTTCVAEGLLEFANETDVKFSHDQIHQALLMSIPPEIKPHLHLRIGKYLLGAVSDAAPGNGGILFLGGGPVFTFSGHHLCRRGCGGPMQSQPFGWEAFSCQMCVCARCGLSTSSRINGIKG